MEAAAENSSCADAAETVPNASAIAPASIAFFMHALSQLLIRGPARRQDRKNLALTTKKVSAPGKIIIAAVIPSHCAGNSVGTAPRIGRNCGCGTCGKESWVRLKSERDKARST